MKTYTATFAATPNIFNRMFEHIYRVMTFYPDIHWSFRTVGIECSLLYVRTARSAEEVSTLQSELRSALGFPFELSEPVKVISL